MEDENMKKKLHTKQKENRNATYVIYYKQIYL